MNKSAWIILFLFSFTLCGTILSAGEQYGFKDIPFGASYEEVYAKAEEIQKQYDEEQYKNSKLSKVTDFKRWKLMNYESTMGLLGLKEKKYVALVNNQYALGHLKVDVWFRFDHNDKFYFFCFETEAVSANYLETKVYEDGNYLINVFKAKYGNPSQCYPNPTVLDIKIGEVAPFCMWKHSDLKIFIGIAERNMKYFAVGNVISKPMEEQYIKNKKQKESESATNGAKSF